MGTPLDRRSFIAGSVAAGGALAFGPGFWREALAAPARPGPGPYGPVGPVDAATGLRVPAGFTVREVARGGSAVAGTGYTWHRRSDGAGCFATPDGGWILVSNSEIGGGTGGASSITFDKNGNIVGARRVLSGTDVNCSGGVTPWGTWLSGEEIPTGQVWECDPAGVAAQKVHPAMGRFQHEAIATDPVGRRLYLTEDISPDGCFYRFTPTTWGDLSAGLLEVMLVDDAGKVTWKAVPDPSAGAGPLRDQVPGAARFARGEGCWYDTDVIYFVATTPARLYAVHLTEQVLEIVYDGSALGGAAELTGIDNVTVHPLSGDVFVSEDQNLDASLDVGIVSPERDVARFIVADGLHGGSELTGPCFDPSGTRMYIASQRVHGDLGAVYEISGPFRRERPKISAGTPATSITGTSTTPGTPLTLGTPADTRRPRLARLRVLGLATVRLFRRTGLPVRVRVDEPSSVHVVVRQVTRTGRRGPVLARSTKKATRAGELRFRLRPGSRTARALRTRRNLAVRVEVRAVDPAGNVATASRRLRLR